MRAIITCGPAIAPIDSVRRITNVSTGELGVMLANALVAAGHEVICFKGEAATTLFSFSAGVDVRGFSTNDDLAAKLGSEKNVDVVFHAAALCDYDVEGVQDEMGNSQTAAKIPSRTGALLLRLKPALKVLPMLRGMFPAARIVGWKYELNGGREDALRAGSRQFGDACTDLSVVNGSAYGAGFGLLSPDGGLEHVPDRPALCAALVAWCAR